MEKLYLFNPISGYKTETNYKLISGITGKSIENLASYKCKKRKIVNINSYIIDDSFSKKDLRKLMDNEVIENEIWKDIINSNGYQISDYARVRRIFSNGRTRLLTPFLKKKTKGKGFVIKINLDGKTREHKTNRLVAEHFIENEKSLDIVFHKNRNIYDDYANNLEWITREELGKRTGNLSTGIAVLKIDTETGEVIDEYTNMADAGRKNYLCREAIRLCIIGESKTSGGFKWIKDTENF